jgi:hypothetical protein
MIREGVVVKGELSVGSTTSESTVGPPSRLAQSSPPSTALGMPGMGAGTRLLHEKAVVVGQVLAELVAALAPSGAVDGGGRDPEHRHAVQGAPVRHHAVYVAAAAEAGVEVAGVTHTNTSFPDNNKNIFQRQRIRCMICHTS